MSSDERPSWLIEAVAKRPAAEPPRGDDQIRPGQIRRLEPMDYDSAPRRLVLVTDVDMENAFATVVLLSPEVDSGSDIDRLAVRGRTGLAYDLLALTDVVGPAWFVQLHGLVADAGLRLNDLPPAGVQLRDDRDARWSWKEQELEEFIQLTGECRRQLLDGRIYNVADPVSFDIDRVGIADHMKVSYVATHLVENDALFVPGEVIKDLDVTNTHPAFDSMQALRFTAAKHKDRLLPLSHPSDLGSSLRNMENDPLQRVLASLLTRVSVSTRCIKVTSLSALWDAKPSDAGPVVREFIVAGRRHQIVIDEVDVAEEHRV